MSDRQPPPAEGVRLDWHSVPRELRGALEREFGSPVVRAETQPSGFSPGVAARLALADGRLLFAKAVGLWPNGDAPAIHRGRGRRRFLYTPGAAAGAGRIADSARLPGCAGRCGTAMVG